MSAIGYSPEAAAAAFDPKIAFDAIKRALNSGALVSHRVGKRRVILADDLVAWVRSCPPHTGRKSRNG